MSDFKALSLTCPLFGVQGLFTILLVTGRPFLGAGPASHFSRFLVVSSFWMQGLLTLPWLLLLVEFAMDLVLEAKGDLSDSSSILHS